MSEIKNDDVLEGAEGVEETEEGTEAEPEAKKSEEGTEDKKSTESPEDKATRLLRQTNQARKKVGLAPLEEAKPAQKSNSKSKSDDLDYGALAYLAAKGIESEDELTFVEAQLTETGKPLKELIGKKWFQEELEEMRALKKTTDAAPKGKRSGGGATDSVEYWATKPIEDVPKEMRIKVVNFKMSKDKNKGTFYNS